MNAGLANLATLKAWLLPAGLLTGTDYDAQIAALGKGVALQLEGYCNRLFERVADDTFDCPADRLHVVLPRYPVEASPTLELRNDLATGYVAQTYNDFVIDENLAAGLIKFGAWAGASTSRLRFTYTGGYFWEQLEPDDDAYPTTVPDGATAVPDDLLLAWRLQCEAVWKVRDKLGLAIAQPSGGGNTALLGLSLPGLELIPYVTNLLDSFKRYSLT